MFVGVARHSVDMALQPLTPYSLRMMRSFAHYSPDAVAASLPAVVSHYLDRLRVFRAMLTSEPLLQSPPEVRTRLQMHVEAALAEGEAVDTADVTAVFKACMGGKVAADTAFSGAVGMARVLPAAVRGSDGLQTLLSTACRVLSSVDVFLEQTAVACERSDLVPADVAGAYRLTPIAVVDVPQLLEDVLEDAVRPLVSEKFGAGACPDVIVERGPGHHTAELPPALVSYVAVELLKNACEAMVQRHGALDMEDAEPIHVLVSSNKTNLGVRIVDTGGGLPIAPDEARKWLSSSTNPDDGARNGGGGYGYSRSHGAVFSGMGVGVARSNALATLLGGHLTLGSLPGVGTSAFFTVSRTGDVQDTGAFPAQYVHPRSRLREVLQR